MKIIGLIGEPASGKSTAMRKFLSSLKSEPEVKKEGLVVYTVYALDKVIVAGIYDEKVFSGTDRLSKGCGPKYREWLRDKTNDESYSDWTFYWEGERFSNSKFFDFFFNELSEVKVGILEIDEQTLNERNLSRSNQNDSWRKGMKTRINNLKTNYSVMKVDQNFSFFR